MQYTKVRDQQLNLATRRQEADSRSVASRRSDFKRKRKLSYNNVVEKKKKKNNRNNNNTNDEIAAVKVEIKKSTDALADLYSRCRNSKDAERLPFNPSLYGCFVDKYIEDKLKVGFIGSYGNRWANKALAECDLLIAIGSRLDIRQTGSNTESFSNPLCLKFLQPFY